jgi:tetratricopeptide (TPR) repeat protein
LDKLSVDHMLMKASSHAKKGEVLEAQKLYQAVLLAFPKNIMAQQELATLNKPKQNNITLNPPEEVVKQLISLYNKGSISAVVEQAQAITKQYPDAFIVWNILGASAAQIEMLDLAITAFQKVISLKPNFADAYYNMGVAFKDQGKMEESIKAYNKALSLKPDYADAYYNMADILKDQDKLDEAIEAYNKCISLKPDYAQAYSNMGVILKAQGKLEKAIEAYKKALSLKPDYADAYYNMANALKDQDDKLEEAIEACKKSISLKPDYAEAHQRLSFMLLNSGRLKEGLDENEWRWKTSKFFSQERHFSQPLWDGEKSLNGKRILLWSEQGIGDTINWSSRLSLVNCQAEHCILECQEKLVPLLERSFPDVEVKAVNRSLDKERDDFDFHLPMGSLYKHFIHEIEQNAKVDAYLIPDPVRVSFWRKRLNSLGKGPYVGICWKSSVLSSYRLQHYPPISEWSPILTIPDVTFINLQYVDFEEDVKAVKDELGVTVNNFDDLDHYNNIDDVVALCAALDMGVTTKNTPMILTSGVGTSTKIANWRQSIWNNVLTNPACSSVDMFERNTWEPWDNVFSLIAEDISELKNKTNNSNYKLKKS